VCFRDCRSGRVSETNIAMDKTTSRLEKQKEARRRTTQSSVALMNAKCLRESESRREG